MEGHSEFLQGGFRVPFGLIEGSRFGVDLIIA